MTELSAEKITEFFEQAAKVNTDAWNSQATYFEALIKRNTECFKDLGEARMDSFREMSEATTFNQAFESNLAFEEKVREDLARLQEQNAKSWESLLEQLTTIYTPAEAKTAKATGKPAPKPKTNPQPKPSPAKKETAKKAA